MSADIGMKIKQMRRQKKMTLKELSEKTDLSISFLSMVERGVTSAALLSLKKIAEALEVNISTFFTDQSTGGQSEPLCKRPFCRSYDNNIRGVSGHYIYKRLSNLNTETSGCILDPMMIQLLPGQTRDGVVEITHEGEEFTYVLEGVLTYFLDGQEHVLYPGDSYHGFANVPHNFANLTNNIVRVIYVVTPPTEQYDHSKAKQQTEDS